MLIPSNTPSSHHQQNTVGKQCFISPSHLCLTSLGIGDYKTWWELYIKVKVMNIFRITTYQLITQYTIHFELDFKIDSR